MTLDRLMPWFNLALGVLFLVLASRQRRGARALAAFAGVMSLCQGTATLTTGWLRDGAWATAGIVGILITRNMLSRRDRMTQFFIVPGYGLIAAIAITELLVDHLTRLEQALFAAIAVLTISVVGIALVRLIRPRRPAASQA